MVPYLHFDIPWKGQPHPDINAQEFSALLEGYLQAPLSDSYQFHILADGGVSFVLNGELIIDHFMTDPFTGFQGLEFGQQVTSAKMTLVSGMLYQFEVKYWRNSDRSFVVQEKPKLKVEWSSEKLPQQPVNFLYFNLLKSYS